LILRIDRIFNSHAAMPSLPAPLRSLRTVAAVAIALAAPPAVADEPPADPPAAPGEVIEVQDTTTAGDRMERSAEAVHVVDTSEAKHQSGDLGEILARSEGVAVRRNAGLGSESRFALDGLYDEQVRFFLDGIPLALAGFPFGIANVPVNLIDRVEIFRGVVPIRFGADALGGAINLIGARLTGTQLSASYQIGSFGTHRATLTAKYTDDDSHTYEAATGFYDRARNDYAVDVEAPDAQGRLHDVTVPRFHDRYVAAGGALTLGLTDRAWADRLELRGYYTGYAKDLQSNAVMTVPYGAVTYGERVGGASARYQVSLPADFRLDAVAAYAHRTIRFRDDSDEVYDWFGDQVLRRRTAGEIDGTPHDDRYWEHDGYLRVLVAHPAPLGELRLAVTPQYSERTGANHDKLDPAARDPLSAHRGRLTVVSGLEYELSALGDAIENIAFAKNYAFRASYEDVRPGNIFAPLSHTSLTFGGGDSLRWRAWPGVYVKASYEYATRLPSTDELFGDGVLVGPNLTLAPETSHNANLGGRFEHGGLTVDVDGFVRDSKNLIVLLGAQQFLTYQNVYDARSIGLDASVVYTPPGHYVTVDASFSYDDLRNASSAGTFGDFNGDRVPNRPYLFASAGARGHLGAFDPFYIGRYVHAFLRGWESLGAAAFQQQIPGQLAHDIGVIYKTQIDRTAISITLEIDNLTNERLFDSFGAQRPGRAYTLKLTADL
jgi:outer membrane receptor protein involved in Fe transport